MGRVFCSINKSVHKDCSLYVSFISFKSILHKTLPVSLFKKMIKLYGDNYIVFPYFFLPLILLKLGKLKKNNCIG